MWWTHRLIENQMWKQTWMLRLIVMRQSSNRPSFHFSKIPLQSRRSIWSVLLISVPAASCVKKHFIFGEFNRKVLLCVGCFDWYYFSATLPLEFADRKCPARGQQALGPVSSVSICLDQLSKAGCCFDHSHSKMPKCVCDWNNFFDFFFFLVGSSWWLLSRVEQAT